MCTRYVSKKQYGTQDCLDFIRLIHFLFQVQLTILLYYIKRYRHWNWIIILATGRPSKQISCHPMDRSCGRPIHPCIKMHCTPSRFRIYRYFGYGYVKFRQCWEISWKYYWFILIYHIVCCTYW